MLSLFLFLFLLLSANFFFRTSRSRGPPEAATLADLMPFGTPIGLASWVISRLGLMGLGLKIGGARCPHFGVLGPLVPHSTNVLSLSLAPVTRFRCYETKPKTGALKKQRLPKSKKAKRSVEGPNARRGAAFLRPQEPENWKQASKRLAQGARIGGPSSKTQPGDERF